jgi:chemotaxis protein MotB
MSQPTRPSRTRPRYDPHVHRDRWLVSYADFITLLFAFFTTMYAISNVDKNKLSDMVDSMRTAFDAKKMQQPPHNSPRPQNVAAHENPGALDELKDRLSQKLQAQITGGQVGLEVDPRGLVITIREAGVFAVGSADLQPSARAVLAEVADAMKDVDNPVRVEGHTDDVPIHTSRFQSNWELSTSRATTVIAFFVQERGLLPTRFSAAGYGEFHPRAANDSEGARAQNRRVDIVILNDATRKAEEPATAAMRTPTPAEASLPDGVELNGPPAPAPAPANDLSGRRDTLAAAAPHAAAP